MKILKGYLSRSVVAATFIVLVGFAGLDLLFGIIGEVDNIDASYTFLSAIAFVLMRMPARIYDMMPIVGLIGSLTGLGALANSSELVVIRSAGVSTLRLVWFSLRPVLVFLLVAILLGEYVAPVSERFANSYRAFALHKIDRTDLKKGMWLRDDKDFVFVNVVQPSGVMYGVNIFHFDDTDALANIYSAERATYNGSYWLLEKVGVTSFDNRDGSPERISRSVQNTLHWQSSLNPELLDIAVASPADLPMRSLWGYIRYLEKQELASREYEIAFWEKVFYPLVMVSLVLVGISFVFGPLRQVTMGFRVFLGVLIGVVFKTLQGTLGPVSIVFGYSPVLAMLTPVILCSLIGLVLLARVR